MELAELQETWPFLLCGVQSCMLAQGNGSRAMLSGRRRWIQLLISKWGHLVQYGRCLFYGMLHDGVFELIRKKGCLEEHTKDVRRYTCV